MIYLLLFDLRLTADDDPIRFFVVADHIIQEKKMKITAIYVYQVKTLHSIYFKLHHIRRCISQVDLPLVDGSYKWADGKSVGIYDSTVVAMHTDHPKGIVG